MRSRPRLTLALLLCSANIGALAQADEQKAPVPNLKSTAAATVSGHVYFADTRTPARKARVYLEPMAVFEVDAPPDRTFPPNSGPVSAAVEAQFDGAYSFTHVAPGSYYVIATCPGYISPFIQLLLAESRSPYQEWQPLGPQRKKVKDGVLRSLARVDVQDNLPATADVVLERGAAVSGTISYDDGSPATGLKVELLARMDQNGKEVWTRVEQKSGFSLVPDRSTTDDRGNYRISGLPPGNYAVAVELEFQGVREYASPSGGKIISSNEHSARLSFFSGSTPHLKDVSDFTLEQSEERTGEDIIIPIGKIHSVRGNIVSARDGHIINNGGVSLTDTLDQSISASDSITQDHAGFTFTFVLEGDYTLAAPMTFDVDYVPTPQSGNDPDPHFDSHVRHLYGSASLPIHVKGDIDNLTIAVPEPTPKETQFYEDLIRQQQQRTTAPNTQ